MAWCLGQRNQEGRSPLIVQIGNGIIRESHVYSEWHYVDFVDVDTHGMCITTFLFRRPVIIEQASFRPPHQIMTWVGLERYGYLEEAQRLAYRFLYMYVNCSAQLFDNVLTNMASRMTTAFVDFNGVVPEKVSKILQISLDAAHDSYCAV